MFQTVFENVAQFKHLGKRITDHNCIQQSIKSRLCSVQNFCLFVCYLKTYTQNYNMPGVLYGREIYTLTLRETHSRMVYRLKKEVLREGWRKLPK